MKLSSIVGKLVYIFLYPLIRLALKNSRRAYVVIESPKAILFTKNWLGLHKNWRLPGGGLKKGESYPQSAVRELKEELGINIDINKLEHIATNDKLIKYYHFKTNKILTMKLHKPEIFEASFINKNKLSNTSIDSRVLSVLLRLTLEKTS